MFIHLVKIAFLIQLNMQFASGTDFFNFDIYNQTLNITVKAGSYDISLSKRIDTNIFELGYNPEPFILYAQCGTKSSGNQNICDLRYTYCDEAINFKCQDCANLCTPLRTSGSESVKKACVKHCGVYLYFKQFHAQSESAVQRVNAVGNVNGNNIKWYQICLITLGITLIIVILLLGFTCSRLQLTRKKLPIPTTLRQIITGKIPKQREPLIENKNEEGEDCDRNCRDSMDGNNDRPGNDPVDVPKEPEVLTGNTAEPTQIQTNQQHNSLNHNNAGCDLPGQSNPQCNVDMGSSDQSTTSGLPLLHIPGSTGQSTPSEPPPTPKPIEESLSSPILQPTETTELKHRIHGDTRNCPLYTATRTGISSQDPDVVTHYNNDTQDPDSGFGTHIEMTNLRKNADLLDQQPVSLMQQDS